jgi:hypothetical protein
MIIDIDELPLVEHAGRLGRRVPADSPVADAYLGRSEPARMLTSAAFTLGLQAVDIVRERIFPSPEKLRTLGGRAGPNYTTFPDCGYAPPGYGTCEAPCYGFEPHHMDTFYCATCDEQAADPVNNPAWNWHFTGSRGQYQYMDREPDVCPGPGGARDAWKWKINGRCGNCQESTVFRCHDGYKKYPNAATWDATICEGIVSCDGKLMLC